MWGLILSAGLGKRMLPITEKRAKSSLPFKGKPIVRHIAERMQEAVDHIGANIFYKAEDIVGALNGLDIFFSLESEVLGTAGGIKRMIEGFSIREDIIVQNGDTLLPVDYMELINFHKNSPYPITLILKESKGKYTRLGIKNNRIVVGNGNFVYCGLMVISKDLLTYIPSAENIIVDFATRFEINSYILDEDFVEVTDPYSYLMFHQGKTWVEKGAETEDEAIIEGSIIMKDAKIGGGAVVKDSVVVSGKVENGEYLNNKIFIDGKVYKISKS